ncbi:MAG: C4-dicarboxylate ABC transporter substrate-binding protein [Burkholderiales bacterium RIFCSPLOWO2_12_FULL_64_99]|nr:MAG: C4-dicarboxylate ABC transporter substrate-binding protein [Burkholderiales bacterium RIFCSPHIGHO2_12_FULL_63_20]OGB61622.1 MAG: C4-dicarboxylate ABC transporter substrate-binding protein [Burkholderiales bacterium RIFCSPLOWO2_12_FULL_64_99]
MSTPHTSVARQLKQTLHLWVLSVRDMLASAGPVLLLAIGLLGAAYWWLDPQPPRTVTLATGPAGSAYADFGQRYAQALARDGIRVQLLATDGPVANLQALREGRADVAFVRGGSDDMSRDASAGIMSLGALFYEPLWLFYRPDVFQTPTKGATPDTRLTPLTSLTQLRGLRVNIDQAGSGAPVLIQRLLEANDLTLGDITASHLPPPDAAHALLTGQLDVIVLVTAPESPVVQGLLQQPGIALADLPQADALARRFPFLQTVSLPRGMVDLARDLPPDDIGLLAATTALLTHEDTHPALRQLFAQAAQQIHGGSGWFNGARDFPNTRTSELPVSPEGDRAINGTPPFWQRYLPFWASNLLERMWLVIGGLIVLLLPLSRVVPPLYTYRVRQRVFRWYARLQAVEARMNEDDADPSELLKELDELDRVASQITVPLAHADELYALRSNIEKTRRRLLARQGPRPQRTNSDDEQQAPDKT